MSASIRTTYLRPDPLDSPREQLQRTKVYSTLEQNIKLLNYYAYKCSTTDEINTLNTQRNKFLMYYL